MLLHIIPSPPPSFLHSYRNTKRNKMEIIRTVPETTPYIAHFRKTLQNQCVIVKIKFLLEGNVLIVILQITIVYWKI